MLPVSGVEMEFKEPELPVEKVKQVKTKYHDVVAEAQNIEERREVTKQRQKSFIDLFVPEDLEDSTDDWNNPVPPGDSKPGDWLIEYYGKI